MASSGALRWPGKPPGPSRSEKENLQGGGIAHLLTTHDWIHRRTEYIRFVDAHRVHRQMGVDFTLPKVEETAALYKLAPGLVPLGTLQKSKLERFSMWDEDGRRLPMLNTTQNSEHAAAALVTLARGVAVTFHCPRMPGAILHILREIARRPESEAKALLALLRCGANASGASAVKALREKDPRLDLAVDRLTPDAKLARQLLRGPAGVEPSRDDQEAKQLYQRQQHQARTLGSLTEELATNFIVFTVLRGSEEDRQARRLLKFEYEEAPRAYQPALTRKRDKALRSLKTVGEVSGWWPKNITLDAVPVGNAISHHIEIEAPSDIDILGAGIRAWDSKRRTDQHVEDLASETDEQRVHLRVSDAPRAAAGPLWVQVRSTRRGFLRAAGVTALLLVALLWAGEPQLEDIKNIEAPAALLLAVPALIAAYLLRPGEHLMASRLLAGPRLYLLGSGLCTFVAVGALAGGYPDPKRDDIWCFASWGAGACALALALAYVGPIAVPWVHRRARRKPGHQETPGSNADKSPPDVRI